MAEPWLRHGAVARLGLEARAARPPEAAGVTLAERAPRGQLVLRGDPGRRAFAKAVRDALGLDLPREPNTAARGDGTAALWLGPDEWLLVTADGHEAHAAAILAEALAREHFALVDVGHARAVLGISGPSARDVLAKACSLDLHPRVFVPDRCAQTTFARGHALVHQVDDAPSYDLYFARSFAEYAWAWLEDAAREYGLAVAPSAS